MSAEEQKNEAAVAMGRLRWVGTTQEQRSEHGRMMASKVKRRRKAKKQVKR